MLYEEALLLRGGLAREERTVTSALGCERLASDLVGSAIGRAGRKAGAVAWPPLESTTWGPPWPPFRSCIILFALIVDDKIEN